MCVFVCVRVCVKWRKKIENYLRDLEELEEVVDLDGCDARGRAEHAGNDRHLVLGLAAVRATVRRPSDTGNRA